MLLGSMGTLGSKTVLRLLGGNTTEHNSIYYRMMKIYRWNVTKLVATSDHYGLLKQRLDLRRCLCFFVCLQRMLQLCCGETGNCFGPW
jgi:hypothetical protein